MATTASSMAPPSLPFPSAKTRTKSRLGPPPTPPPNATKSPPLSSPVRKDSSASRQSSSTSVSSPSRKSRFQFVADTKAPTELKEFSAQAYKRHTDFRKRVNALDHKVAAWSARFANEVIARDKEMVSFFEYSVADPLERCAERFMRRMEMEFEKLDSPEIDTSFVNDNDGSMEQQDANNDSSTRVNDKELDRGKKQEEIHEELNTSCLPDGPSLSSVSKDTETLRKRLLEFRHVTVPALKSQHFDSLELKVTRELAAKMHVENIKTAKRELAIDKKFEAFAGLTERSLCETNAKRVVELEQLREKINEAGGWDEKRTSNFLEEVRLLRESIAREREERMKNDELVLEKIVESRVKLHKILLESMTTDED
ncbi:hypothetical protein CTEN210_15065 [Chaetoceros tenuissimus]|uniref:Uncharacterized protein n=1 Tax=Chaetoceros tenuissimus TaxID=426638 RepID=A0AAD3D9M2_9STRA|nr:hypothetical protein CTEN210_15065 [Chaetoceros tenuissimus]